MPRTRPLFAVAALALLCAGRAPAQNCLDYGEPLREVATQFNPRAILDVAADGDMLYVAHELSRIWALDVSDPRDLVSRSVLIVGGQPTALATSDGLVYATSSPSGALTIADMGIDGSEPPSVLALRIMPGPGTDLVVDAGVLTVADGWAGLQILDVSDPTWPVFVTNLPTDGDANAVAIDGDLLVVATDAGLAVYDRTDPLAPVHLATSPPLGPGGDAAVCLRGTLAYVSEPQFGVRVLDLAAPFEPQLVGTWELDSPDLGRLHEADGFLYLINGGELLACDVSDPTAPELLGTVDVDGAVCAVGTAPGRLDIGTLDRGLFVMLGRSPVPASLVGSGGAASCLAVAARDGLAYTVRHFQRQIEVVDLTLFTSPTVVATVPTQSLAPEDIVLRGSYAYVAGGGSGIEVLDLAEPLAPVSVNVWAPPPWSVVYDLVFRDDLAFVPASQGGMIVVDASAAPELSLVSVHDTPGLVLDLALTGDLAVLADHDAGVQVVDVSDPAAPALLGTADTPYTARLVAAGPQHAFVLDGGWSEDEGHLMVVAFSDPANPAVVLDLPFPYSLNAIELDGDVLYLASGAGDRMLVLDVSTPWDPWILGWVDVPAAPQDIALAGDHAHIAGNTLGIAWRHCGLVTGVADPTAPGTVPAIAGLSLTAAPNPFNPRTVIAFELDRAQDVTLDVLDLRGRRVARLAAGRHEPGRHQVTWTARDDGGRPVASGVYVMQLQGVRGAACRRVCLLR